MTLHTAIMQNAESFAGGAGATTRSFFVARNPTAGTGIASLDAATARSATANLMTVFNSAATGASGAGEPYVIVPIRLWLRATAVNTSASALSATLYLDSIDRYTSGGTAIVEVPTIKSGEPNYVAPTSKATINFGVLVTTAESDETKIYDREILTTILAADDTFDFWFGESPGSLEVGAGATGHHETTTVVLPPVYIRPGATMIFDTHGPSQAADPAWEFEFWYLEMPNAN